MAPNGSLPYHPAFGSPVRYTVEPRPQPENDETSTAQTIARMAQFARNDSGTAIVRGAAQAAIAAAGAGQVKEIAQAIHAWIRSRVRFVDDAQLAGFRPVPEEAEVLVRPVDLLGMPEPQGDCDDSAMLCAAMLRAAGIPTAFKTVACNPADPETYTHVYAIALLPDGPLPLDCSTQRGVDPRPGWEVKAAGKSRVWPVEETMKQLSGLGVDWGALTSVINTGMETAGKILVPRYGVPQLNEGQYMRNGNTVLYQQPAGSPSLYPEMSTGVGGGSTLSFLLLAGFGLLAVMLIGGRR